MNADFRKKEIIKQLNQATEPISASVFAKKFGVSRQVIVGDISLIRAAGTKVEATPKGYKMQKMHTLNHYVGKVVCKHSLLQITDEFKIIIDNDGELVDVSIDHPIYGELTGRLDISNHEEARLFLETSKETDAGLLANLTNGIHLHTIACDNKKIFDTIKKDLQQKGILYEG